MKTYFYIGTAVAAVLSAAAVNAQVLGGSVAGGLGGTLSGGMRDMNVITHGSGDGSFGGGLEAGSLHRSTTDITGRTTNIVRNTAGTARERTRSGLNSARAKTEFAANAAASAAADTTSSATAATRQIDATANIAGSLASDATTAGSEANGALDVMHQEQLQAGPAHDLVPAPNASTQGSATHLAAPAAAVVEGSGAAQGSTGASKNRVSADASAEANGAAGASLHR